MRILSVSPSARLLRCSLHDGVSNDALVQFDAPKSCYVLAHETETASPPAVQANGHWREILVAPDTLEQETDAWIPWHQSWLDAEASGLVQTLKQGPVKIYWLGERAIILAPPDKLPEAVGAFVDFAYHEDLFVQIELGVSKAWPALEDDVPLSYKGSPATLKQDEALGQRVVRAMQLRLRLTGIEERVSESPRRVSKLAGSLGAGLRQEADCERRAETANEKIDAMVYVYELISGRLGEFRNAREGFTLEVVIIFLLAAEVLLMVLELFQ